MPDIWWTTILVKVSTHLQNSFVFRTELKENDFIQVSQIWVADS